MTIDELAQRTGMTVRNIRAHQSRGLLSPPEVRGRTGYYGPEHARRIEFIRDLQRDGFNLKLIKRLLDTAGGLDEELLRFSREVRRPFGELGVRELEPEALMRRWRSSDPELLRRALELGVARRREDGKLEESVRLGRVSEEIVALGIPAESALEVAAALKRHSAAVSRAFVELFLEQVWAPFDRAGRPEERWQEVRDALERLRPIASQALLAFFEQTMTDAVETAFGRQIELAETEVG